MDFFYVKKWVLLIYINIIKRSFQILFYNCKIYMKIVIFMFTNMKFKPIIKA